MPLIPILVLLTLIVIALLFVLRQLKTENKELKRQVAEDREFLQQLRTNDPLTQVMARQQFMPLIEQEFQRAKRNRQPLSLISCSVDHLHQYQRDYGNFMADESLYAIAQTIDGAVKRAGECVGRMGWERFWILLPNVPEDKAIALAEIIQEKVHALGIPYENSPITSKLTISMGIVSFIPSAEEELTVWTRSVEIAMEKAKEEGGDRWHVAT